MSSLLGRPLSLSPWPSSLSRRVHLLPEIDYKLELGPGPIITLLFLISYWPVWAPIFITKYKYVFFFIFFRIPDQNGFLYLWNTYANTIKYILCLVGWLCGVCVCALSAAPPWLSWGVRGLGEVPSFEMIPGPRYTNRSYIYEVKYLINSYGTTFSANKFRRISYLRANMQYTSSYMS